MAQETKKEQSHLGFFVAMLAVAVLGYGSWVLLDRYYFTAQQQQQTAEANPSLPPRPRRRRARPTTGWRASQPRRLARRQSNPAVELRSPRMCVVQPAAGGDAS